MSSTNLIHNYSSNARAGFISAIHQEVQEDPQGAMAALAKIIDGDFEVLSDITLAELFPPQPVAAEVSKKARGGGGGGRPRASNSKPRAASSGSASTGEGKPANDTPAGAELKEQVLGAIRTALQTSGKHEVDQDGGAWVKAATIRELIGDIKPTKLRAVLGDLIEGGKVTFMGKAAGTKYSLA